MHWFDSARATTRALPLITPLLSLVAAAAPLGAQVAPGSRLRFAGSADATDLGPPGVALDFVPTVAVAATGNTGSFASLNRPSRAGVTGTIADLRVGRGPQRIPNLLSVGGYRFDLLWLPSGPYGQAQCSRPHRSPA